MLSIEKYINKKFMKVRKKIKITKKLLMILKVGKKQAKEKNHKTKT